MCNSCTSDVFAASGVHLSPTSVTIQQGDTTTFSCSLDCSDYSIIWLMGWSRDNLRQFTFKTTPRFLQQTGLHVEVTDHSSCSLEGGQQLQQEMTFYSTSTQQSSLLVQCLALPAYSNPSSPDLYSNYTIVTIVTIHPVTG